MPQPLLIRFVVVIRDPEFGSQGFADLELGLRFTQRLDGLVYEGKRARPHGRKQVISLQERTYGQDDVGESGRGCHELLRYEDKLRLFESFRCLVGFAKLVQVIGVGKPEELVVCRIPCLFALEDGI